MLLTALLAAMSPSVGKLDQIFLLESLDLSKMEQSWSTPKKAKSVDDHTLSLGGRTYTSGVGTHAYSQLELGLGKKGRRFTATVGLDDETQGRGSIRFLVYLDGKVVDDSGVMKSGAIRKVDVDLTGAKALRLVVEDAGDGIDHDHADWADAKLIMVEGTKAPTAMTMPVDPPMKIASHISDRTEIHGPRIIGCTPGREFLYRIPITGKGPMQIAAATNAPGLHIDIPRRVVYGRVANPGEYELNITATGPGGKDERTVRIVAGEHKLSLTPPMGWNSWNVWAGNIDADKVRAAADSFVNSGLADFGYSYVNIDDCWEDGRDANGEVKSNAKFPDMESLTNYVHGKGLKIGLYSSPGPKTCAGFEGSYLHELQDAQTYARWGFDYLKYDWCSYGGVAKDGSLEELQKPYIVMRQALDRADRDIVFSLCQYGMGDVSKWGKAVGGNLWRTTGDITDTWFSMSSIGFAHSEKTEGVGPGGWNDPDMLIVGEVGWGNPHPTGLKPNEQITHITLWSLLAAPLIIGCDMTRMDAFTKDLLMNHDVIEVDQDPLGKPATRIWKEGDLEAWARPLWDGTQAVGLFNRGYERAKIDVPFSALKLEGSQPVRDLWLRKDLGTRKSLAATVLAHGAQFFKVGKVSM